MDMRACDRSGDSWRGFRCQFNATILLLLNGMTGPEVQETPRCWSMRSRTAPLSYRPSPGQRLGLSLQLSRRAVYYGTGRPDGRR